MQAVPVLFALLLLAGCKSISDSYAPPIQRNPVYGPEDTELRPFVNMNDPRVEAHIVRGVSHALESGTWRWTDQRPELRFALVTTANQKFRMDFVIAENTFRETGPVTLTFFVNDNVLDKVRYDSFGEQRFEKPVPSAWLQPNLANFVAIEVDKPWISPADKAKLGFILVRAGFVE